MKTFKEYLLSLPYPYNYLAILRTPKNRLKESVVNGPPLKKSPSLENALKQAFSWACTPKQEGHGFWKQVCHFAAGESQALPPIKGNAHYFATFLYDFDLALKKKVLANIKKNKAFEAHQEKEASVILALAHSFSWSDSIEGGSFWREKDGIITMMARKPTFVKTVKTVEDVKKPVETKKVIVSFGGENSLIKDSELADFKTWAGSKKVKDFAQNKVETISI